MNENTNRKEQGQSIIIVVAAMIVLLLFVIIAVDLAYAYVHRRSDQNAADASSLAGARELGNIYNANQGELQGKYISEQTILEAMNDFAEQNSIADTDGTAGNAVNTNVTGYYLAEDGSRLSSGGNPIEIGEVGFVNPNARGVEAVVHSVAPTFFGGFLGLNGLPIQAEAAVVFQEDTICVDTCVMPIATLIQDFQYDQCYNIWDAIQNVNHDFGWLNWKWNKNDACKASAVCTLYNMDPTTCASGRIKVGGWVANDGGVSNSSGIRNQLNWYIDNEVPFTVVIYDIAGCHWEDPPCHIPPSESCGCKTTGDGSPDDEAGMGYHVVGFGKFLPTGYFLASGGGTGGNAYGDDGSTCLGPDETGGNRITGYWLGWVEGEAGNCTSVGTIMAPRVVK